MSFESHFTILSASIASKAAEFASRHPVFLDGAMRKNATSQAAAAKLLQEQPNCPDLPSIMRTIINTEKSVNRTLRFAVVSHLN